MVIGGDNSSISFPCDFPFCFYLFLTHIMILFSEKASFMLTRKAFRKPSLYKGMHQTKSDVSDIIKFMVKGNGDIGVKVSFSFKAFHQK